jgi:hypothetical protein
VVVTHTVLVAETLRFANLRVTYALRPAARIALPASNRRIANRKFTADGMLRETFLKIYKSIAK